MYIIIDPQRNSSLQSKIPPALRITSSTLGQSIVFSRFRTIPTILSDKQVKHAVLENNRLKRDLGWDVLEDAIVGWIFQFNPSPTAESFAQLVADHQMKRDLPVNGILDANTWYDMLCKAKNGIPVVFKTPEGISRPIGLNVIIATFGDPTKKGWESSNIEPVVAPTGQKFAVTKAKKDITKTRVHKLLKPHFGRLFADIHSAGLWKEIFPTSGTYVCRTKASYGKKICGTKGIRFEQLSTHSWGITIDIKAEIYPRIGNQGQRKLLRYPPVTITSIFQEHGFHWGLWFMKGELDASGRIDFTDADPMHFQFATGY